MDDLKRAKIKAYLAGEAAGYARFLRIRGEKLEAMSDLLREKMEAIDEVRSSLMQDCAEALDYESNSNDLDCPNCWIFGEENALLVSVPSRHAFLTTLQCPACSEKYTLIA